VKTGVIKEYENNESKSLA